MKKPNKDRFAKRKRELLAKRALLTKQLSAVNGDEKRQRKKDRARLCYIWGDVLVSWLESGQPEKKALVESVNAGVPADKTEFAKCLIALFTSPSVS